MQIYSWHRLTQTLAVGAALAWSGCDSGAPAPRAERGGAGGTNVGAADGGSGAAADIGRQVCAWVDESAALAEKDEDLSWYRERFVMELAPAGTAFVAVGAQEHELNTFTNDVFMRVSCDGDTWLPADVPARSGWLREVAFGNETLVTTGDNSDDPDPEMLVLVRRIGQPWQSYTRPIDQWFYDLSFGNGTFLARDARGLVRSQDGVNWESIALDEPDMTWMRLFFDGERFVTHSKAHHRVSVDGREWQEVKRDRVFDGCGSFISTPDAYLGFCGDNFLEPGGDIIQTHVYALSWPRTDALGAATISEHFELDYTPYGLAILGDRLIAFSGSQPAVTKLPIGSEPWEKPRLEGILQIYGMTANSSKLVAAGYGMVTTTDGITWTTLRL